MPFVQKKGTTDLINPQNFASEIESIETGGSGGGSEGDVGGIEYLEMDSVCYVIRARIYGNAVPSRAFYHTAKIVSVELANSIATIGENAFYQCSNLVLTELPSDITSIGISAFYGCSKLALTELPSGLTSISNSTFSGCTNLALTELPSGVTSIGNTAFKGCSNLTLTELPSGVTSILTNAFNGCYSLTSITFKGTPTLIANNAFSGCTNLLTINVPWAEGEVANAPWGATNATINYNYVDESKIFMTKTLLNRSITEVRSDVTSVGSFAFEDCNQLRVVDLPNATLLGNNAFKGCISLTALILRSNTKCSCKTNEYPFTSKVKDRYLYVPASLVESYKNDGSLWRGNFTEIRAIEDYPDICDCRFVGRPSCFR